MWGSFELGHLTMTFFFCRPFKYFLYQSIHCHDMSPAMHKAIVGQKVVRSSLGSSVLKHMSLVKQVVWGWWYIHIWHSLRFYFSCQEIFKFQGTNAWGCAWHKSTYKKRICDRKQKNERNMRTSLTWVLYSGRGSSLKATKGLWVMTTGRRSFRYMSNQGPVNIIKHRNCG